MDLFYRGYDTNDRVASGAKHLAAAAARIAASMVLSIPMMPESAWNEFKGIVTFGSLWGLCVVVAGWVIATVVGGPIGLLVNGILITYGLYELWGEAKSVLESAVNWTKTAYYATSPNDLAVAGRYFAEGLSAGILTALELIVTHRLFRAAERRIQKSFPSPDWLRKGWDDAIAERERTAKSRLKEAGKKAVDAAGGLRYEGTKQLGNHVPEFPSAAIAVGSAVAVVAIVGGVALAISSSGSKS